MPKHPVRLASTLALILAAALSLSAHTQGLPPPPGSDAPGEPGATTGPSSFDVASVHEHSSDDHNMRWMTKDDGTTMVNIPLQSIISMAYDVKMYLISGGPSWVNSKGFDLDAKVLSGDGTNKVKLTDAQRRALMRALLVDRFHLQAHVESKQLPVYDLVVAKGGPKIKAVAPPAPDSDDAKKRGGMSFAPGHMEAQWYPISNFAEQLGYMVQRTVIDKTGLTGEYNLALDWTPDDQLSAASDKATTGTDPKPSIYAAIQEQLGLKLVPSKGPVNTLVIDHAELPTAN